MKKILLMYFVIQVLFCVPVFADDLTNIATAEKEIFGVEYKDEAIQTRLSRIEKHLFGKVNQGTTQHRLNKISETSGIDFAPKMTKAEKQIAQAEYNKEDTSVSYPVIDMMEEKIFNKNYQGENVYKRVSRLEEHAFGRASDGELSERTDKLKAKLLAIKNEEEYNIQEYNQITQKPVTNPEYLTQTQEAEYNYRTAPYNKYNNYPTGAAANISDFEYALTAAENMIFGKNYSEKSDSERLNKLENKIFKRTYTGDKVSRLERVVSAATAKNSSNIYKENKLERYISTGIQVGSILLMILAMIL